MARRSWGDHRPQPPVHETSGVHFSQDPRARSTHDNSGHALRGCITNAKHAFVFLVEHAGYWPEEIVVLTDDSPNPRGQPTRKNMIKAMKWLLSHSGQAFIKAIKMHPKQSFKDLIDNMREILAKKYSQHPQLGSSHPIDTRHRFLM
ncbi:hypothetical protein FB45DRAFT_1035525 [Roridomyces roridus]|uniref:Uncharacterized protein n=1 Tax=Roridomyces roridus TaxID=1738132 RepID=A0AAD7FCG9_9AGAR|nr:hypothetical protein FB45DRAFT_1035525 [Roridomyces roridus]